MKNAILNALGQPVEGQQFDQQQPMMQMPQAQIMPQMMQPQFDPYGQQQTGLKQALMMGLRR
jgi:hypothetical protein